MHFYFEVILYLLLLVINIMVIILFVSAVERQNTTAPETTPVGLNNQSSAEQATGSIPSAGISEQNLRLFNNKYINSGKMY